MKEPKISDEVGKDGRHYVLCYAREDNKRKCKQFRYFPDDKNSYKLARQSAEDLKTQWLKDKENNSDKIGGELTSLSLTDQALLKVR